MPRAGLWFPVFQKGTVQLFHRARLAKPAPFPQCGDAFPSAPDQCWHLRALEREQTIWQRVQLGALIRSGEVPCVSLSPCRVTAPKCLSIAADTSDHSGELVGGCCCCRGAQEVKRGAWKGGCLLVPARAGKAALNSYLYHFS